jgi:hypothetical protein
MSYTPPINEKIVKKAEDRFIIFASLSGFCLFILIISFFISLLDKFWKGNRLWVTGSLLIFISVVHLRYFNIEKVASHRDNRHFNKNDFRKSILVIEKLFNLAWLLGFFLFVLSRFISW